MAKTKQDYITAGRAFAESSARNGQLCAAGYPVGGDAPAVSMNGSWQMKAWREGYDTVRMEMWGIPGMTIRRITAGGRIRYPGEMFHTMGRDFEITAVFPMGSTGRDLCNALCAQFPGTYAVLAESDGQIICADALDKGKRVGAALADMPTETAHALGAHITQLRIMANQDRVCNPARAHRLTNKADALLQRWGKRT